MIMWKPLVGECLQLVKEPINEVDKNVVAVLRTNFHCKDKAVGHVQQNISIIVFMLLSLAHYALQLVNA